MPFSGFPVELFGFIAELKENNERDWFNANKSRYESQVKRPIQDFIEAFAPRLRSLSPVFVADASSMFRIYRDTRFAKDKSPYKTHAAAQFRHDNGKDVHAPCFYLHLEPGSVFMGGGIWHPDPPSLNKIRTSIQAIPARWKSAREGLDLRGDSLAKPPKGVAADHPWVEDLKRKDFMWCDNYSEDQVCASDFVDRFTESCRQALPLCRFLCEAMALEI